MAHANADVVRSYIDALAAGDLDAVAGYLTGGAEFHVPGRNRCRATSEARRRSSTCSAR